MPLGSALFATLNTFLVRVDNIKYYMNQGLEQIIPSQNWISKEFLFRTRFCTSAHPRGSNFDNVFDHNKRVIIGPPGKRHLNGVSLASRWCLNIECWLGSFVIFLGIRTSIAQTLYIFVIFQGGRGGPDPLSPLWVRPCCTRIIKQT